MTPVFPPRRSSDLVSKSTTCTHLADYLALRGYRVLVVDCDPQASMSVMFDVNLEALVDETHTLSNFLSPRIDEADSLRKTIQKTAWPNRSEEHTSELQSLMRISYAVFCLKKQTNTQKTEK